MSGTPARIGDLLGGGQRCFSFEFFPPKDEAGEDAKLICVPPGEPRWADVDDVSHLTPQLMAEIRHFFEVYKALEPGKYASTTGIGGRADAWREIEEARANYVPNESDHA